MKKICFLLLLPFQILFSQNDETLLMGLWEVTNVTVGSEQMTPIAKWVEFKPDHTHRGGNGWVQHSIGTWDFDKTNSSLSIVTSNGFEDIYPPFKVIFNTNTMQWKREEDGQAVVVTLNKIEEIPAAYSDKVLGLWQLKSIKNEDITPSLPFEKDAKLFMRTDRRYIIQLSSGRKSGVWNTHPHRQRVRLLSDEGDAFDTNWEVSFEGEKMVWRSGSEKNANLIFERIHRF